MNASLVKRAKHGLPGKILSAVEVNGTVALVEQRGDERWYHAREFTRDGRRMEECGGYSTKNRYWYMGERYRIPDLWGEYFTEVFK